MDIRPYMKNDGEKPLDRIAPDGGFCGIFRTIGCIGDSLSSGEFESLDENGNKGYHDCFEYSWGQYMARAVGSKAYNFSRGGMTASEYWNSFAEANGFWGEDKLCQAYIIALGVNDFYGLQQEPGSVADIDPDDCNRNKDTFTGYYARIIQRIKSMQPKARFFLVTMPRNVEDPTVPRNKTPRLHTSLMHSLAEYFDYTYVIDLFKYGPVYDDEFKRNFYLAGHLNPAGYLLTARMFASYIDYLVRTEPEDFAQVGFIGLPYHNCGAKW